MEDVCARCRVRPVVVLSLEAKCGGDALDGAMDVSLRPEIFAKVATMLLEEDEQESVTICEKLQEGIVEASSSKSNFVTRKDIGLANADAEYQPLSIDPFKTTVCLSGKAVTGALVEKHNGGTV